MPPRLMLLLLMRPPALLNHDLTMMLVVHDLRVQATRTDIMINDLVFDNDGMYTTQGDQATASRMISPRIMAPHDSTQNHDPIPNISSATVSVSSAGSCPAGDARPLIAPSCMTNPNMRHVPMAHLWQTATDLWAAL